MRLFSLVRLSLGCPVSVDLVLASTALIGVGRRGRLSTHKVPSVIRTVVIFKLVFLLFTICVVLHRGILGVLLGDTPICQGSLCLHALCS